MTYTKLYLLIASLLYISGCAPAYAENIETVYQTIAMECVGEPAAGQVAVAKVILNRAEASYKSLDEVCKMPKQFSCWNHPGVAKRWLKTYYTPKARGEAINALKQAYKMNSSINFYHNDKVYPKWAKGHKPTLVIGHHLFYSF